MRALLWFKQDLRLDDHPALQAGLSAECLLPVYVLDPEQLQLNEFGMRRMGVHRARFLLESLVALEGELRQRGSHLLLVIGSAEQVIPQLVAQFNLDQVLTLEEIAPDHFFDSEYYKTYYLKAGSSEDSFYLVDTGNDTQISVSLFQGFGGESLRVEQLNLLRAVEPLVREFIAEFGQRGLQHRADQEASGRDDLKQRVQSAFEHFGSDLLTEREREVAHMVLRGHSVKSTASQLSISPETVRMHRKNLYLKLEVGSQSELFALFIEWLRRH